jgi:hypothetical protein
MYAGKEKQAGRGAILITYFADKSSSRLFDVSGPSSAEFIPNTTTKSGSTNLPEGTVHVYRQCNERRQNDMDEPSAASASETVLEDGLMLGVLAVPAWMTPSDFLAFVAPAAEGMAHLRLIRCALTSDLSRLEPYRIFSETPFRIALLLSSSSGKPIKPLNLQKHTTANHSILWT